MAIRNAGESANIKSYYIKQTLREADSEVPWNPALRIAETVMHNYKSNKYGKINQSN